MVGLASMRQRPFALKHGSDLRQTLPKRVSDNSRQLNFRRKKNSARFFGVENRFKQFWSNFGGSTEKRTSPATSSQFFALNAPIMSSVRLKIAEHIFVGALGSALTLRYPPCQLPPQCI